MTWSKRILDLVLAVLLLALLAPVMVLLMAWMALNDSRPFFYVSERMKTQDTGFNLIKFRTMKVVSEDQNKGVSGGDKTSRITGLGKLLRRSRLDELPQLINVIKGDMSFVGPRPPLRQYVQDYPEIYGQVLKNRPGITGLASLVFHAHEERLLSACKTAVETEDVYRRRCIPRKAQLDLIYQRRRTICLDIKLMGRTAAKLVPRSG